VNHTIYVKDETLWHTCTLLARNRNVSMSHLIHTALTNELEREVDRIQLSRTLQTGPHTTWHPCLDESGEPCIEIQRDGITLEGFTPNNREYWTHFDLMYLEQCQGVTAGRI
jgi:hypothetical protein